MTDRLFNGKNSGTKKAPAEQHSGYKVFLKFAAEVLVVTAIFCLIAAGAVAMSFLVKYLDSKAVDPLILTVLKGMEYLVLGVDFALYLVFILKSAVRMGRQL